MLFPCYKCKDKKPLEEFGKAQLKKGTSNMICLKCDTERSKAYNRKREENRRFNEQFFKVIG